MQEKNNNMIDQTYENEKSYELCGGWYEGVGGGEGGRGGGGGGEGGVWNSWME